MEPAPADPAPDEPRPRPLDLASLDLPRLGGCVFIGFGAMIMLIGLSLLLDGDFAGGLITALFGAVFCGVGYGASRAFRTPPGMKRVLVDETTQRLDGPLGTTGQRTSRTYRYVADDVPDAEIAARQQQWAEQPWTQRADWSRGVVVDEGPASVRLLIIFAIIWNVMAWGFTLIFFADGESGGPWFVLIFPLVGLTVAVWAARLWLRKRKFGASMLRLARVPVPPGERLRGTVEAGLPWRDAPAEGFHVRLRHVQRSSYRDSDGDRHVREETLWETETTVPGQRAASPQHTAVPIDVPLPPDARPTEMSPADDRRLWRLHVTASVPGIDYAAQFEVPVFAEAG